MKNNKSREILRHAEEVLTIEADAVRYQLKHLDDDFIAAVHSLAAAAQNQRKVIVMGIGKSGLIGRKIAATLSSTGTPAIFFHPSEGMHGDLGMIQSGDVLIALSASGETEEIKKILPVLKDRKLTLIALTSDKNSRLGKSADWVICSAVQREACPLNLAPSASTTAMLALGDALAIAVMKERKFKAEDFARLHPGGSLGKRLSWKVEQVMRKGKENPVVQSGVSVREALLEMTRTQMGATLVINKQGRLTGFFTDGDLRRQLQKNGNILDVKIDRVMTKNPKTISADQTLHEAMEIFKICGCDNAPVIDKSGRPLGILDERDIL